MDTQLDEDGYSQSIRESTVDYKTDGNAVTKENMYIMTKSGKRCLRKSTTGWKLLVKFKDGAEQWMPLKVLKETHPVQVAEFSVARNIDEEPDFK